MGRDEAAGSVVEVKEEEVQKESKQERRLSSSSAPEGSTRSAHQSDASGLPLSSPSAPAVAVATSPSATFFAVDVVDTIPSFSLPLFLCALSFATRLGRLPSPSMCRVA